MCQDLLELNQLIVDEPSHAEILSHVDHPNIVKTFDIYDESTLVHIVMELMSGGELFERVKAT